MRPSELEWPGWYSISVVSLCLSSRTIDTLESTKSSRTRLSSGWRIDTFLASSLWSKLLEARVPKFQAKLDSARSSWSLIVTWTCSYCSGNLAGAWGLRGNSLQTPHDRLPWPLGEPEIRFLSVSEKSIIDHRLTLCDRRWLAAVRLAVCHESLYQEVLNVRKKMHGFCISNFVFEDKTTMSYLELALVDLIAQCLMVN